MSEKQQQQLNSSSIENLEAFEIGQQQQEAVIGGRAFSGNATTNAPVVQTGRETLAAVRTRATIRR